MADHITVDQDEIVVLPNSPDGPGPGDLLDHTQSDLTDESKPFADDDKLTLGQNPADVYNAALHEAQTAPIAFSLAQLLAVEAFQQSDLSGAVRSGSVLLLGTSLCIEDAAVSDRYFRVVSREARRVPGEEEVLETSNSVETDPLLPCRNGRSNKRATAGGNLQGVLSDVEKMRKYFLRVTAAAKKRQKYVSYDVFEVWNQRRNEGKKDMVKTIKRFFAQKYKYDAPQVFVIYYSGHGTQDGDWAIGRTKRFRRKTAVDFLTIEELISLWRSQPCCSYYYTNAHLIIVADSCHSGKWVQRIDGLGQYSHITMIAACGANETCSDTPNGGDFTANLLREPGAESISFHPAYTDNIKKAGCNLATIVALSSRPECFGGGDNCCLLLLCICCCWPYLCIMACVDKCFRRH